MPGWWWLDPPAEKSTGTAAQPYAFLDELRERARRYGWAGDYTEVIEFVRQQYVDAHLPVPDLTPYEEEDG